MAKILKIKLFFVLILLLVSSYHYDLIFVQITNTSYTFTNLTFMIASLCFGVILSTAIYNVTLYFYLKSRQHLFYALAQFSTVLFLIILDSLNSQPFDEVFGITSNRLFDMSQLLMLVFMMLFIKEFLKNYFEYRLTKLINIIVYLALFDMVLVVILGTSVLSRLVPIFIPIWLLLSEAYRIVEKKDIPFLYLFYGWYVVMFIVVVQYLGFTDYFGIVFPFFHIALAIDALMLSLAISYKFKLLEEQRELQQTLLLQQSRLASMGEMVAIIAHQWRQPLNFLSFSLMNIKKQTKKYDEVNEKVKTIIKDSNIQLQYMSKTIENFRNFYNPSKSKEYFSVHKACQNVLPITALLSKYISIKIEEDFTIYGNQNEFEQVILNILNNSNDIFLQREIQKPQLKIVIYDSNISITDNAGGIKKEHQEKIFEPYFSTKEGNDGIGLYISKIIVEQQMKGRLTFCNIEGGARFLMVFKN